MIDFLKRRYIFLILSLVIIVVGLVMGFNGGFKLDIDFLGGTKIQVELNEEFTNSDIENLVKEITGENPLVQTLSTGNNSVSISTSPITEDISNEIIDKISETYVNSGEPVIKNIQPAYGEELIESAIIAILVSIILILLYIIIRFKTLGVIAAITAIIALIHDALVIIAIYGIFGLSINSTFIAVILTIIGYSINDTIVVYDRIRENRRKVSRSEDIKDTINLSLNQTIKRTVFTSITTLIAIVSVYVLAYMNNQQVLQEFALPLTIGVIVGTYSSIFIASSLWYEIDRVVNKKNKIK